MPCYVNKITKLAEEASAWEQTSFGSLTRTVYLVLSVHDDYLVWPDKARHYTRTFI